MRSTAVKNPVLLAFFCFLFSTATLYGFGKNKVQYVDFTWNYLPAAHFNLYYHQSQGELPSITYHMAENIYRTLGKRFQFIHREPVPIIIYGDPNLFSQTNVITEILPEEVGGFTELFKNRVVVPFTGSYDEFNHVVHHEMVHAFMYGIFFNQPGSNLMSGGPQIPLWFMEGLAEYLSAGWSIESDMFLMDYTINGQVPPPGPQLNGYMAYKGGQSFLLFLAETRGDSLFTRFLREFKTSKSLDNTMKNVYKKSLEELGKEWIQELKRIYWPEIGRRMEPERNAKAITTHTTTHDNLNLRPRISPDGKRIAFFSDRSDYTSIIITNRSGKVEQEISQTGYGGYFESFHPFRSGMCWSPDGKNLAFVTKSGPRDQIRIVDLKNHRLTRTISPQLASIAGPDWSRDGAMITFAGVDSGTCDLYLYTFSNDAVKRLTKSPAFKSDPHFSPDSRSIIYSVQDSCSAVDDPPMTTWGKTPGNLALFDLKNGSSVFITNTPWDEKQPVFSPSGKQVLFVSDKNGIDNLYIAPVVGMDSARPVTDYIGGCSNPDWSSKDSSAVFTLFQKQGWDVWLMEKPLGKIVADSLEKTKWVETMLDSSRHYFRPAKKIIDTVTAKTAVQKNVPKAKDSLAATPDSTAAKTAQTAKSDSVAIQTKIQASAPPDAKKTDTLKKVPQKKSFEDTAFAKPPGVQPSAEPYRLKFSPDMVGVGLGMSSFYGPAGQWLLSLSDIMGDHRITLAGDVQTDFKSTMHFFASYAYLKNRIDFAGGAYYYKDYAYFNQSVYYFDAEIGAFVDILYPFSMFSRLEFAFSGRNIDRTPWRFSDNRIDSSGEYTANTLLPLLSYSYDNILWGLTGPLNGTRAEISVIAVPPLPNFDFAYASFTIDYRKYAHLFKRFVWANRVTIGASQSLSSDMSPSRFFLGGNDNWYNYSFNTDNFEKNARYSFYSNFVVPFRGWNYFDLTGTRVAVFNTEFRFPFVREISTVFPLPMEIHYINGAVFADIGNAWDQTGQVSGLPLPKKIYGGIGFGCRANLGFFVLRYDRGWPVDVTKGDFYNSPPINYFSLGAEF